MMTVNLITVGKLKESYLKAACDEYAKRLKTLCKLNIVELNESKLGDNPSEKEILMALSNEAKAMIGLLTGKDCYNITMCIEGKQLSSVKLSDKISQVAVEGKSTINIIIGSSFGIADEIKNISDFKLSMSEMTFPHQLARVMILEQIYRAFQIQKKSKYHK